MRSCSSVFFFFVAERYASTSFCLRRGRGAGRYHPPTSKLPTFLLPCFSFEQRRSVVSVTDPSVGWYPSLHPFLGAYLRPKALRVAFIFVAVNLSSLQAVIRDKSRTKTLLWGNGLDTTIQSYLFRDIHRWFNSVLLTFAFDLHQHATIFAPIGCLLLHPCA